MSRLIEALQIFLKYGNPIHPTSCKRYVLYVLIHPVRVSDEDKKKLRRLGFYETKDGFRSYKYGST